MHERRQRAQVAGSTRRALSRAFLRPRESKLAEERQLGARQEGNRLKDNAFFAQPMHTPLRLALHLRALLVLEGGVGAPLGLAVVDLALEVVDDLGGLFGAKEGRAGDDDVRACAYEGMRRVSEAERAGPRGRAREGRVGEAERQRGAPARAQHPTVFGPTPPSTWMSLVGNRVRSSATLGTHDCMNFWPPAPARGESERGRGDE